jgi:diguanylate cyclase (GGDEF)-like protein
VRGRNGLIAEHPRPTFPVVPFSAVQRFALAVFTAGAVALFAAVSRMDVDVVSDPAVYVLGALVIGGDLLPVTVRRRGAVEYFMASSTFSVALLLYAGPAAAITAFILASLVSDIRARCTWERLVFNAGQYAVSLTAAALTLLWFGQAPGALGTAELEGVVLWSLLPTGLAFFVTNHLLVGTAIAMQQRSALLPVLREDLLFQLMTSGVLLAIAPVVVVVAGRSLWLLPCLLIPVFALHRSTKQSIADAEVANHDALTGLPNRSRFQQVLRWELDESRPGASGTLMLIDLCRFGEVNETLGHTAGDELLRLVAERLVTLAGPQATVARVGGDEFGVLAPGVHGNQEAVALAERVLADLTRSFALGDFTYHLRPRIGLTMYPRDGHDSATLLRHGDVAMRLAKQGNGSIELYSSRHDHLSRRRLEMVNDLRDAIAAGDIAVAFQPKADLLRNRIVGVEALARWHHPGLGHVGPDEFIPLAERAGLIGDLTDHVLERSIAAAARFREAGFPLHVAVNLSVGCLQDEELPGRVAELLDRWDVSPADLHLEITESTIMAADDGAEDGSAGPVLLTNLRALGAQLAVDDFGTGYSSLARLKHLPVDQMKIDKSFVRDMEHDPTDAAIIRSSLELARSLEMVVVAEGVESLAAWNALRELGCDQVQGFFLSRPLAEADLLIWLRTREARRNEAGLVPALLEDAGVRELTAGVVRPLFGAVEA